MIYMSLLVTFVISILFNVILPTGDVYSDVGLMVNTLQFDLGNTRELAGCRVCYGKEDNDLSLEPNHTCPHCLENIKSNSCGESPGALNKLLELQNSQICHGEKWKSIRPSLQVQNDGHSVVEQGVCRKNTSEPGNQDFCCFEKNNQTEDSKTYPDVDMRAIFDPHTFLYCADYYWDVLVGNASLDFCRALLGQEIHIQNQLCNITKNAKIQSEELVLHVKNISEQKVAFERGFKFEDVCGVYLRPISMGEQTYRKRCGIDTCLVLIQNLKLEGNLSGIRDLNEWKTKSNWMFASKIGGKNCWLLKMYGWTMALPLILSLLFNVTSFYNEMKYGDATNYDILSIIVLFYPQWKSLKILARFIIDHRDEEQLNKDMSRFDKQIGSLEPFVESAFQVIIS